MIRYVALLFFMPSSNSHLHCSYLHEDKLCSTQFFNLKRWMSDLPDSVRLHQMSIPGTHDSVAHFGFETGAAKAFSEFLAQTQTMRLKNQLDSGIRALDIRPRHFQNKLPIYHGPFFQRTYFVDVLKEVTDFLSENPTETVLMRVKEEHQPDQNDQRTFGDIFYEHTKEGYETGAIWAPGKPAGCQFSDNIRCEALSMDPTLGEIRGKIVILQQFDSSPTSNGRTIRDFGLTWNEPNFWDVQDDFSLNDQNAVYGKWLKIKDQLTRAQTGPRMKLYVNFLSATGTVSNFFSINPVFPYFVASGHAKPESDAPRLLTGFVDTGIVFTNLFPDFPRTECFIQEPLRTCAIAYEGMNTLFEAEVRRWNTVDSKHSRIGIIFSDFPGCCLIETIIDVNMDLK